MLIKIIIIIFFQILSFFTFIQFFSSEKIKTIKPFFVHALGHQDLDQVWKNISVISRDLDVVQLEVFVGGKKFFSFERPLSIVEKEMSVEKTFQYNNYHVSMKISALQERRPFFSILFILISMGGSCFVILSLEKEKISFKKSFFKFLGRNKSISHDFKPLLEALKIIRDEKNYLIVNELIKRTEELNQEIEKNNFNHGKDKLLKIERDEKYWENIINDIVESYKRISSDDLVLNVKIIYRKSILCSKKGNVALGISYLEFKRILYNVLKNAEEMNVFPLSILIEECFFCVKIIFLDNGNGFNKEKHKYNTFSGKAFSTKSGVNRGQGLLRLAQDLKGNARFTLIQDLKGELRLRITIMKEASEIFSGLRLRRQNH
jgi:hypothetical protein